MKVYILRRTDGQILFVGDDERKLFEATVHSIGELRSINAISNTSFETAWRTLMNMCASNKFDGMAIKQVLAENNVRHEISVWELNDDSYYNKDSYHKERNIEYKEH